MEQIIEKFGLDWRLLIAQLINFAILFAILKIFVYKPIFAMLKKRREDIEKGIEFTKEAEEQLKRADQDKETLVKEAKERALKIVSEGEAIAESRKEEMLSEASKKRDGVVAEAREIIDEHKNKTLDALQSAGENLVRAGIAKVLGKMPASERDSELIKEALKEVRHFAKR